MVQNLPRRVRVPIAPGQIDRLRAAVVAHSTEPERVQALQFGALVDEASRTLEADNGR